MAILGLSDAERAQVEAAVSAAERRTAARFAIVVVHASDDYATYPMLWAAVAALLIGDAVALVGFDLATWWIVVIQAGLFITFDPLFHLRQLRFRLVPRRVKKSHAHRLAKLEFASLVHDHVPGDIGLLLFVSEAERHVEILADRRIDQRVDQAEWDKIVAALAEGIAGGAVSRALSEATAACADILARHFPAVPDAATRPGG